MSWQAVARKDFEDAARSRWLWALSALFVVLIGGSSLFFSRNVILQDGDLTSDLYIELFGTGISNLPGIANLLVPLISFVLAYSAITGERESGTIKLLLSLPHSRLDVVLGKAAGRSAVIAVPILLGFLLASVVFLLSGVVLKAGNLLAFSLLTILLGVTFVSIAIGFSAGASSRRRAMVGVVATYFLFTLFWDFIRRGVIQIVIEAGKQIPAFSEPGNSTLVNVSLFVKFLNPIRAYETLVATIYTSDAIGARLYGAPRGLSFIARSTFQESGGLPFYLSDAFVALVLLAWLAVPLALGYLAFSEADLV